MDYETITDLADEVTQRVDRDFAVWNLTWIKMVDTATDVISENLALAKTNQIDKLAALTFSALQQEASK